MKKITFIIVLLIVFIPSVPGYTASSFTDLLAGACISPSIEPGLCVRVHNGEVQVGTKVSYFYPVGVIEVVSRACQFSLLDLLAPGASTVVSSACQDVMGNAVPGLQASGSQMDWQGQANNMKLHVHIYTIPPALQALIEAWIKATVPITLPCFRAPAPLSFKACESSGTGGNIDPCTVLKNIPVKISELISPIWGTDASPDLLVAVPVINATIQTIYMANPWLGLLVCPGLTQIIADYIPNPAESVIDIEFICVGTWGFGYPRVGVVQHDNWLVAAGLAGVRFWHLLSKTIPIIEPEYSTGHRLQLAYPKLTPCFHPGDPFLIQLQLPYSPDPQRRAIFIIWKRVGCCSY